MLAVRPINTDEGGEGCYLFHSVFLHSSGVTIVIRWMEHAGFLLGEELIVEPFTGGI